MAIIETSSRLAFWRLRALRLVCAGVTIALAACSDVRMTAAPLVAATPPVEIYVVEQPVTAAPVGGQSRTLRAGSRWALAGTIAEGMALRPIDGILTAEAKNVHEAYLVVHDTTWVGFWLPYGQSFSAAEAPARIHIRKE